MHDMTFFGVTISSWILVPVIYFVWASVLLVIKRVVFKQIERLAKDTKVRLDDIMLNALNVPLTLMIFVSGIFIIERMIPAGAGGEIMPYFVLAFKAVTIIAVVLFLDKLFVLLIKQYAPKVAILKASGGIAQGIIRVLVIGLGVLILLDSFGVSITPLLASLGIGSLAVALALQPTLENFFSGLQILIDKPIQVGQFVQLDSGEQGYVEKVGWRSSWIRMLANNVVVIPNKVLVSSKIINYYYPSKDMAVLVQVGVHYESDLDRVEQVTIEVGEEVLQRVTGGVPDFKPFIRYHTFADFSINFSVILRCQEFVDNYLIKHEFIKALHKRYATEGISIPYPIRAVNFVQEQHNSQDTHVGVKLEK